MRRPARVSAGTIEVDWNIFMAPRTETLAKVPLFRSLAADTIAALDRQCSWRRAPAGQWIIDYQDASSDVFFVVSGAVRVVIQSAGREGLLRQINAGEVFGGRAALDEAPLSSGIVAMTDVTVARMSPTAFRAAAHAHPDVCDQLLALLAGQIRMLANRVNEFSTLDVRHRIHAELLRLSRTEPADPARAIISPPPVHAEIAPPLSTRRARQRAPRGCGARIEGAGARQPARAPSRRDRAHRRGQAAADDQRGDRSG